MYVEIKNNKLLSWCKNAYLDYQYVDIDYESFDPNKYEVQNGTLVDITNTDAYKNKINEEQKASKIADLTLQIESLDKKRIRAIAEPALKDAVSGKTWLEYYTEQIASLRNQIATNALP